MAVSIQQAAQNALATYLRFQLTDVQVEPRWVANDKRFPFGGKVVSIIPAGHRIDNNIAITQLSSTPRGATYADSTWKVALCTQPLHLDVWTTAASTRDEIIARLDEVLRRGAAGLEGLYNFDPVSSSVLLNLGDGWDDTIADFEFGEPDLDDTPAMIQRALYRASFRGNAYFTLTVSATTPRQRVINFTSYLDGADAPGI